MIYTGKWHVVREDEKILVLSRNIGKHVIHLVQQGMFENTEIPTIPSSLNKLCGPLSCRLWFGCYRKNLKFTRKTSAKNKQCKVKLSNTDIAVH